MSTKIGSASLPPTHPGDPTSLAVFAATTGPNPSPVLPPPAPASRSPRRKADSLSIATRNTSKETRGLRRAEALIASGKFDQALEHLRKLVCDVPGATRTYVRMASLLRERRRAQEALEVLRDATHRNPHALTPREALAELCLEMGRFDEAIVQCRALIEQSPRSLFARDLLSAAYLQRGMLDHALRTTEEMIGLDPSDPVSHFKRGVLLQQKGQTVRAVQAFLRVLEMDSDCEAADESRAALEMLDCSQLRQIFTLAMDDWAFRWRLKHNSPEAITNRGFLLSERGLAALAQMHFDDFPQIPAGWRQYHYH